MTDAFPKITFGISTSVLFDMREANAIYENEGKDAYERYMLENSDDPLPLGPYFETIKDDFKDSKHNEIVICSRNSPLTARRALLSLVKAGITPERMYFTNGKSPVPYMQAHGITRYMTTDKLDAQEALKLGIFATYHELGDSEGSKPTEEAKASKVTETSNVTPIKTGKGKLKLKPAFDGGRVTEHVLDLDGVVFSPESEQFFRTHGLTAYFEHEKALQKTPITQGPAFPVS